MVWAISIPNRAKAKANTVAAQKEYSPRKFLLPTHVNAVTLSPLNEIVRGRGRPSRAQNRTNATIPAGEVPEEVSHERAVELIAERRAKGPAPKKPIGRRPSRAKK